VHETHVVGALPLKVVDVPDPTWRTIHVVVHVDVGALVIMAVIERCGRLSRDKAKQGSERRTRDGNRTISNSLKITNAVPRKRSIV
jgi:hypothetical protein